MRVVGKTVSQSETSVELDLFDGRTLPTKVKKRIQEEVGNFLIEQTLVSMNEKKSPVQGEGSFKALSKDYKKKKLEEVGSGEANLEFDGVMKDELNFFPTKDGIEIGVYGERAGAADGHNNLSGKSQLPTRRFLPDEGQNYKKNIQTEVDRIVADAISEEIGFKKSDFRNVTTKKELFEVLSNKLGPMSRAEMVLTVFRNQDLVDILTSLDLLGFF
jgi:hypothetical protein